MEEKIQPWEGRKEAKCHDYYFIELSEDQLD